MLDFKVNIADLENRIKQACIDTLEDTATIAVGEIQVRTPVKTGALRRSMTHDEIDKDKLSVNVGSSLEYAKVVEEGHEQGWNFIGGRWMIFDGMTIAEKQMEYILKERLEKRFNND